MEQSELDKLRGEMRELGRRMGDISMRLGEGGPRRFAWRYLGDSDRALLGIVMRPTDKGVQIAASVDELHGEANNINKETALTERGETVKGRGDEPNQHDILTGTQLDGTAFAAGEDMTCGNWTSSGEGAAMVGHHDRQGGGPNPTSWNSAHPSRGCSLAALQQSGGSGLFYCFAID